MNLIKSIFGALVGAAAAMGVYFVVKEFTGETFVWFPIVTGILTGMVAASFGGPERGTSIRFLCGAGAALIAAVAIFGIDFLPTLTDQEKGEFGPLPAKVTGRMAKNDAESSDDKDSDADATGDTSEDKAKADADNGEESTSDGEASGDSGDSDKSANADDDAAAEKTETAAEGSGDNGGKDAVPAFRRGRGVPDAPPTRDPAASDRFAELIKKKKHESWMDTWLPFVFSGIGILCAYQLARGFSSGPKTEGS